VVIILAGLVVCGLVIVAGGLLFVTGAVSAFGMKGAPGERFQLQEVTLEGKQGQPKIVQIPVTGMITSGSLGGETSSAELLEAQLDRARKDDNVKAILLTLNSGGGGVTGSDIMHQKVMEYKKATGEPVVACMRDIAASGAYYVAAGCDRIIAHPTTVTGSIGVIVPLYDATELMKSIGVKSDPVTSGKFKDMGSPFVEQPEGEREKERELFQELVDSMYERFVKVVAEGRGLDAEKVKEIADGRVFTSQKAVDLGLVDSIGYYEDAVSRVKESAGIEDAHIVTYKRILTLSDMFGRLVSGHEVNLNVAGNRPMLSAGQPMYLWTPPAQNQ
jgi:protease-4